LEQARERNTKGVNAYKRAYDSLKACPFPFSHPSETQQLQNIGTTLAERLTEKMEEYCKAANLPMPVRPRGKKRTVVTADGDGEEPSPPKKKRTSKPYVPALRSGAYAIVLALSTTPAGLTKQETIALAEPHCDSSFTAVSGPGKFYTAWSSIKTLENKDLVYEQGRPTRKYFLTEEGWEVAKRIKKAAGHNSDLMNDLQAPKSTVASSRPGADDVFMDISSNPDRASPISDSIGNQDTSDIIPQGSSSILPMFESIVLPPGTFTVQLVLDNREVRAKDDRDYIQIEMSKQGVKPIVRPMTLGDITWVAKCHDPQFLPSLGVEGDEVVLDFVVERKRLDDLLSSIKDGRFHEQKFRLRKSGVKNVIYLIEEISMSAEHFQKYEKAVQSAIASTQVVSGYFVKKTQKVDDTIRYLARMTAMLKEMYETKPLHIIPTRVLTARNYMPLVNSLRTTEPGIDYHITYEAFASLTSKSETLTLRDVFLKMLMCTKGVTGERALEIQKRWKTPRAFMEAYKHCGDGEDGKKKKIEMVSKIMAHFVGRKKITKAVSLKIAEVWGNV
jgi:crossover junction endonuclease MUS81